MLSQAWPWLTIVSVGFVIFCLLTRREDNRRS